MVLRTPNVLTLMIRRRRNLDGDEHRHAVGYTGTSRG